MKTLAAVLVETGKPLVLAELEIPALQHGQVLVEIAFSGVCHTQILECRGYRGEDKYLPHCLGHEGSGTVLETGPGVTKVKAGDRAILSWMKGVGSDNARAAYRWGNRTVNAGAITTFSRHAVISENRLTTVLDGMSMMEAAMMGCAVPTGFGAVLNTAQPSPGQSLVIFGTGGIGLCAVAGAAMAGCTPIIAVDVRSDRLELAQKVGATHAVLAGGVDPVESVNRICPGGVDFALEASGRPDVMQQALRSVHGQGGTAVIIGNARDGEYMKLDPKQLNMGKRLLGTWGGDNKPDRDFPRYGTLLRAGTFHPALLLSTPYRLSEVNQAIDDLEAGRVTRPLIHMAIEDA